MRRKAILIGNRVAQYHPLCLVETNLRSAFELTYDIEVWDGFKPGSLDEALPCLVIGYEDIWERTIPDEVAGEIVRYVEKGGGLLLIHNGICWANHPRVRAMVGARFVGHPEKEVMEYRPSECGGILDGIKSFRLLEEPYRYEFENDFCGEILLRYDYAGRDWIAGWKNSFGAGRVVCLQPGHLSAVFENDSYMRLLLRCGLWSSGVIKAEG